MPHALTPKIDEMVKKNKVIIFMKGSPDFPMCGFSNRACQILKMEGVSPIAHFDVLSDDPMWEALEDYTKWPTVPQIFIDGKFVGGCDILTEMHEKGELKEMLAH